MAEGTIISFAEKLSVMIVEEYRFLKGVEEQVVYLRDELEWISSFLRDAAAQRSKYERVDVWISQIRNLAYDAEDVLDIFIHKVKRLPGLFNYPRRLQTLHDLGNQIDSINRRIEKISTCKSKYAIEKLEDRDSLGKDVALNKKTAPDVDEADIVGFKNQSEAVANKLKQEEDSSNLHVVSIIGMPGAGKSTLARMVYNDVKNRFDSYAWIDVSQEFKSESLLQSIKKQNNEKEDMGTLLVVFDDVWRKKDWDALRHDVLGKINNTKIKVLLTSRFCEVATHSNSHMVDIEKLNTKDGLKLLKKKVFHKENFPSDELKEVAEKIVGECHGLPLAIVVLGGLLSTKQRTFEVWNRVLQSVSWHLLQGSTECFEIVGLSYDNLPNVLKPCFLYFGIFPEDHLIDCENLIQLWIAEGFIQERGEETMEDVAEDYLEELIQRNLIQVEERRSNGSLHTCRVHDLLQQFAISKGRQDKFLDILGNKGKAARSMSPRLANHSWNKKFEGTEILDSSSLNNLRSMLCFNDLSNVQLEDKSFFKDFKLLRVLDLRGTCLECLPDEIGELILLKYLKLGKKIRGLPSSTRCLRNLQTLDISDTQIDDIPWPVWELEKLRHFYANLKPVTGSNSSSDTGNGFSCNLLLCCIIDARHPQIRGLRNLQTLSTRVDNWICKHFSQLTNLMRKLQITEVNMDLYGEALSNSICNFIYLQVLDIEWSKGKLQFPDSLSQHVHLYNVRLSGEIEKFPADPDIFPPNLTELYLERTALKQEDDPIKTLAALKNLKFLELQQGSFLGKQIVFPAQGFSNLIDLNLILTGLEELKAEEESLPNLKSFYLAFQCRAELPPRLRHLVIQMKIRLSLYVQKASLQFIDAGAENLKQASNPTSS